MEVLQLPWQSGSQTSLCAFFAPKIGSRAVRHATDLIDTESPTLDIAKIKALLAEYLKPIAIPQVYVPLWSMPVTTQGKLDRKALRGLGDQLDLATWTRFSGSKLAADPVK